MSDTPQTGHAVVVTGNPSPETAKAIGKMVGCILAGREAATPRTDAASKHVDDLCYHCRYVDEELARVLERENAALRAEVELNNMQLVGCMTASIQNTETTVKDRIARDHPYWSQAYEDVCQAVDREMVHRAELAEAKAEVAHQRARVEMAVAAVAAYESVCAELAEARKLAGTMSELHAKGEADNATLKAVAEHQRDLEDEVYADLKRDNARLRSALVGMLFAAENADETGYVTDVGFIDPDKLYAKARAALAGTPAPAAQKEQP